MSEYVLRISGADSRRVAECMKGIADGLKSDANEVRIQTGAPRVQAVAVEEKKEEPPAITSMEIAEMFGWQHTKVFNMITKFLTTEAGEDERNEFQFVTRTYRNNLKHKVCRLSEKGCGIFMEKICTEERRKSKRFMEGTEKLKREVADRFGGAKENQPMLMNGRSRTECQKIKELFDRFITGPALEDREIAELTEKYREFHDILKETEIKAKESNRLESAVYGVAVEAEMQGFIYGFKLYEELLNRSLAVA